MGRKSSPKLVHIVVTRPGRRREEGPEGFDRFAFVTAGTFLGAVSFER